jgi:predicted transposase YdaD
VAKPYDATSRDLLEFEPADWVRFLGATCSPDRVHLVDTDLSSVTAEADKVIRVEDPSPWILHLEFQTSSERALPVRLSRYNAMLQERHHIPIASAVILLRPEANAATITGEWRVKTPITADSLFSYRVVRVWQLEAESLLNGGLSLLPLAPIANVQTSQLPGIVDRLKIQLDQAPNALRGRLWTAIQILLGLRHQAEFIEKLLEGVIGMEDSTTYQAILKKGLEQGQRLGREEGIEEGIEQGLEQGLVQGLEQGLEQGQELGRLVEAREAILRIGRRRLRSEPPSKIIAYLDGITDHDQLITLLDRSLDMTDWSVLIGPQS